MLWLPPLLAVIIAALAGGWLGWRDHRKAVTQRRWIADEHGDDGARDTATLHEGVRYADTDASGFYADTRRNLISSAAGAATVFAIAPLMWLAYTIA